MECRDFLTTLGFVSKIPFSSHLSTEFVKVPRKSVSLIKHGAGEKPKPFCSTLISVCDKKHFCSN